MQARSAEWVWSVGLVVYGVVVNCEILLVDL